LSKLVGKRVLPDDQRVEAGLVVAEPGVVLKQLGVERAEDHLEAVDPALGVGDLVLDADRLRVDLRQLVLIALDLRLQVAQRVSVRAGRQEGEQQAGGDGQRGGAEFAGAHEEGFGTLKPSSAASIGEPRGIGKTSDLELPPLR